MINITRSRVDEVAYGQVAKTHAAAAAMRIPQNVANHRYPRIGERINRVVKSDCGCSFIAGVSGSAAYQC
jgi:hypothetical protein